VSVQGLTSHLTHNGVISETSLSKQLIALILTTINKETKHYIVQKEISEVVPYFVRSTGHGADPGLLAVSPQATISHKPGGRLPLVTTRPAVTFPAKEITPPLPVPNYTAW